MDIVDTGHSQVEMVKMVQGDKSRFHGVAAAIIRLSLFHLPWQEWDEPVLEYCRMSQHGQDL